MADTVERLGLWRTQAAYDLGQANRLTGVSAPAIKQWLKDYPGHIAALKPPWRDGMGRPWTPLTRLSFLELIEILVAGQIRAGRRGGYREVREYHDGLAAEWDTQFPFAHQNLLTHKERLPAPLVKSPEAIGKTPEAVGKTLEAVGKTLGQLDYEDGFAARWHPQGKAVPLSLDPQRAGGQPTIKGRRLRVADISDYFAGGQSVASLARDFQLDPAAVEAALRFAISARASG